jgi:hypothetical protein
MASITLLPTAPSGTGAAEAAIFRGDVLVMNVRLLLFSHISGCCCCINGRELAIGQNRDAPVLDMDVARRQFFSRVKGAPMRHPVKADTGMDIMDEFW